MAWDEKRKSHQGLLDAGYSLHSITPEYPAICRFCNRSIVWYTTPKFKVQPFDADTFEPHHGTCSEYQKARKEQKTRYPNSSGMPGREPGDETTQKYPD
jgi:hypothetical protein